MSGERVDATLAEAEDVAAAIELQADIAWWDQHGQTPSSLLERVRAWLDTEIERCPECEAGRLRKLGTDSGLDLYGCLDCGWTS